MPDLDKNIHFGGADDVSGEDLGRAEVPNFTSGADAALHSNFDWSGKAIGFIGLTLNPENDRVASGVFVTRGETELEEFNSTCDQIWPQGPPNISFGIRVADLNQFTFNGGGLWSDLIPGLKFKHGFFNKTTKTPILGAADKAGIGEFCLRLVCQPSSTSSGRRGIMCKFTVLLFPASAAELADTAGSQHAGFPGFKIGDGHFPLGPAATTKWKCPIVPLIRPGTPFEENENAPSSTRLRFAIASIMRKAKQPDIARSCASLQAKWEKIRNNPRELTDKAPATTWPEHPDEQDTAGE